MHSTLANIGQIFGCAPILECYTSLALTWRICPAQKTVTDSPVVRFVATFLLRKVNEFFDHQTHKYTYPNFFPALLLVIMLVATG